MRNRMMIRKIRSRLTAALLCCAMVVGSVFSAGVDGYAQDRVQAEEEKKEWDEDKIYQADFTFMLHESTAFWQKDQGSQPVKVKNENLMVDLEWLADGLGLVLEKDRSVSKQNIWTAVGDMKPDEMTGTETVFRLRKSADSTYQILLCTGAPTAVRMSYYLGQSSMRLGAPVMEEELEDGTVRYWAPLNDILFLVDSHAYEVDDQIRIFPCKQTAVDILHEKNFTERFYCDVLEDSGLEKWEIGLGTTYKAFYDQLKNMYGGVVKVDFSALFKLFPAERHEEAGAILANQMCSGSLAEFEKQKEAMSLKEPAFDTFTPAIQEFVKLIQTGTSEKYGAAAEAAKELFEDAMKLGEKSEISKELFRKYNISLAEAARLGKVDAWWKNAGKFMDGVGIFGGAVMSGYVKVSMITAEMNRINRSYLKNVQTFLKYCPENDKAIADPVRAGMSERIELYSKEGKDCLYTEDALEESAKYLAQTTSTVGAALAAPELMGVLAPYQWINTGWEVSEQLINRYSSGAFDALDALKLSLYGMQVESASLNVLLDYRSGMRAEWDETELKFDESKMETFSALAWVYLKSCYVTRQNMLDFYKTQKEFKPELYELAFAEEYELQKEACRYMAVLLDYSPEGEPEENGRNGSAGGVLEAVRDALEDGGLSGKEAPFGFIQKLRSPVSGVSTDNPSGGRIAERSVLHEDVNWTECQYLLKAVRDDDRQIFYDYLKSDYIPEYGLASLEELSWNLYDIGASRESDYMKENGRCGLISAVVRDFDLDGVTDMVAFRLEAIPDNEVWPEIFNQTKPRGSDFVISADFYTLEDKSAEDAVQPGENPAEKQTGEEHEEESGEAKSPQKRKVVWKDTYPCLNWLDGSSWGGIWIELEQLENGIYIDSSTEAEDMITYGATPRTIFHVEDGKFVMDYIMGIHWGQSSLDRNPNRLMGTTNINPQDYSFGSRSIPFEEVNPDGDERENRCVYWGEFTCTDWNRGDVTYRGTDYTGLRTILKEGTKAFPHKPLPQGGLKPEHPAVAEAAEAVKPLADYIAEQSGCVYVDSDSNYYEESKVVVVEYETEEYSSITVEYDPETKQITYMEISNNSYPVPGIWFRMKDAALSYPGFGLDPGEITQFFGEPYNYPHFANGIKIKGATVSIIQIVDTNVRIQFDG